MPDIDSPAKLAVFPNGELAGNNDIYTKHLADMTGVYRDSAAYDAAVAEHGGEELVYRVESQSYGPHSGALTIGTSTLLPGRYGDEFAVTRGHLHAVSDRAELYYCLSGERARRVGAPQRERVGRTLRHALHLRDGCGPGLPADR